MTPAPATIVVAVPAEARLYFNGIETKTRSDFREFESPDLAPNMIYQYVVKAEMVINGKTEVKTETVQVRAGQQVKAQFTFETKVASK
jgi:uncharacterized protein (TIGR03000 family)